MWVPLVLFVTALFVGLQALQEDSRRRGIATVDATRYRLHADTQWLSQAWIAELERLLVRVRELPADDPAEIRRFTALVGELPFVSQVGVPEIQWPDGLSIPIRLHEPVACIRTGDRDFLPIAANGTVLGGYSYAPHEAYGGWLPTIGPHGLAEERHGTLRPGDVLDDVEILAALSVADSMWRYLRVEDLRLLGRVVIDASADSTPVVDPGTKRLTADTLPGGVVLSLEEGRRVWFGRPPEPLHEGELPAGYKWQHVRSALEAMARGENWALLDARFDAPTLWTRAEVEALSAQDE